MINKHSLKFSGIKIFFYEDANGSCHFFSLAWFLDPGKIKCHFHSFSWQVFGAGSMDIKCFECWPASKLQELIGIDSKVICQQNTGDHVRALATQEAAQSLMIQPGF